MLLRVDDVVQAIRKEQDRQHWGALARGDAATGVKQTYITVRYH